MLFRSPAVRAKAQALLGRPWTEEEAKVWLVNFAKVVSRNWFVPGPNVADHQYLADGPDDSEFRLPAAPAGPAGAGTAV